MREKQWLNSGLVLVLSSLMAFSLLGPTTEAQQEPGEGEVQRVAVSRKALVTIASELSLVRESVNEDLKRLEKEYLRFRQDGGNGGDPREKAIRGELERQKKTFNRLVDQMKKLQLMAQGKWTQDD